MKLYGYDNKIQFDRNYPDMNEILYTVPSLQDFRHQNKSSDFQLVIS